MRTYVILFSFLFLSFSANAFNKSIKLANINLDTLGCEKLKYDQVQEEAIKHEIRQALGVISGLIKQYVDAKIDHAKEVTGGNIEQSNAYSYKMLNASMQMQKAAEEAANTMAGSEFWNDMQRYHAYQCVKEVIKRVSNGIGIPGY